MFSGETTTGTMKRTLSELVGYLTRGTDLPQENIFNDRDRSGARQ